MTMVGGRCERLTLEGYATGHLHQTVRESRGQLIFYRIPHATIEVGILGQADGIIEVPNDKPDSGWKEAAVPLASGLKFGFLCIDAGRYAEDSSMIEKMRGVMRIHIPADRSTIAGYTGESCGIKVISDRSLIRQEEKISRSDWILAAGNNAVIFSALSLAEDELATNHNYIGFQESHGLLLLSAIKDLGIDWQKGQNREQGQRAKQLEDRIIDYGVVPLVAYKLGWETSEGARCYSNLVEERVARRLGAFNLPFDRVRERVVAKLSKLGEVLEDSSGTDRIERRSVVLAGGNYQNYLDEAIDNILKNYLGISPSK